jgi:ABC-type antimicrobial peptide transport system permease subunit
VRAQGDPAALIAPVRAALRELEPGAVIFDVMPMAERLSGSLAARRFNTILLASFSGIALLLAGVGIYGVLAYAVRQRTREIGVRVALGARRADILGLVMRQGMSLVGVGLALGLAGALALTRLLTGLLFDIAPTDPATWLLVPSLLLAIAALACWLPARRAAGVDPMEALRQD